MNRYLSNHVNNLFAGAWEPRDVTPLKVSRSMASPSRGKQIYDLMINYKINSRMNGAQLFLSITSTWRNV